MASRPLTETEIQWWQRMVELMQANPSVSRPDAKVYAFLLLQDEPITLDELAAGAGMAKTAASTAVANLVRSGTARRQTVPGSNRRVYDIDIASMEATFVSNMKTYASRLEQEGEHYVIGAALVTSETVRKRLELDAEFCRVQVDRVTEIFQRARWRAVTSTEPE